MRVIIIGKSGQLGSSLMSRVPAEWQIIAPSSKELNLARPHSATNFLKAHQPDLVINAGAWTDVDGAESKQVQAYMVNAFGPAAIAHWCNKSGVDLIHISTDYVFDGTAKAPMNEDVICNPLNCYGKSKLMGEQLIVDRMPGAFILRTAWLYSMDQTSFAMRMLQLAKEHASLRVVTDQIGNPTYAPYLARSILNLTGHIELRRKYPAMFKLNSEVHTGGVYHAACTGMASRYSFVSYLLSVARRAGLAIPCKELLPVPSTVFPTPAQRPGFNALDCSRLAKLPRCGLPAWQNGVRDLIQEQVLKSKTIAA